MDEATHDAVLDCFGPEVLTLDSLGGEDNFFPRREGFRWPSA
jgi:hypothetical protein